MGHSIYQYPRLDQKTTGPRHTRHRHHAELYLRDHYRLFFPAQYGHSARHRLLGMDGARYLYSDITLQIRVQADAGGLLQGACQAVPRGGAGSVLRGAV